MRYQGCKEPVAPFLDGKTREVILGRRKVLYLFEFRHKDHLAIGRKAPTVVLADESVFAGTGFGGEDVAPVGAYIGKTIKLTLCIFDSYQGFIDDGG